MAGRYLYIVFLLDNPDLELFKTKIALKPN